MERLLDSDRVAPSMNPIRALLVLMCLTWACGNPAKPSDSQQVPIPSIKTIVPSTAKARRTDLAVTMTGTDFVSDPTHYTWAIWTANGTDTIIRTTVLSSFELSAIIPAALLSNPGEARLQVTTGDPNILPAGPAYPRSNAVTFEIVPDTQIPAEFSGTYRATFTASASCASKLPERARERTYDATLFPSGDIHWSGPTVVQPPGHDTISSGQLSSTVFSFRVDVPRDPMDDGFNGISDEIENGVFLNIAGAGTGELRNSDIIGTFSGLFAVWPSGRFCQSTDHRFTFVKQ